MAPTRAAAWRATAHSHGCCGSNAGALAAVEIDQHVSERITLSPNVSRPEVRAESCWRAVGFREVHSLESLKRR